MVRDTFYLPVASARCANGPVLVEQLINSIARLPRNVEVLRSATSASGPVLVRCSTGSAVIIDTPEEIVEILERDYGLVF